MQLLYAQKGDHGHALAMLSCHKLSVSRGLAAVTMSSQPAAVPFKSLLDIQQVAGHARRHVHSLSTDTTTILDGKPRGLSGTYAQLRHTTALQDDTGM